MTFCRSVGVALALALALGGCNENPLQSSAESGEVAAAEMALVLPDNSQITSVSYTITGPSMFSRMGTVNVGNSRTVRFRVSDLPVNTGSPYTITLSATTSDNVMCSGGPTDFLVNTSSVVSVMLNLTCGNDVDNSGDVSITADVQPNCPAILGISALPREVFIGSDIALHVSHTAGSTGRIMWSGSGGAFSAATAADTNFTCQVIGTHTLTVTLTEGTTCSTMFTADVECSDGGIDLTVCGDGDPDPGEDCDDGNTVTETCAYNLQSCTVCNASCQNAMGAARYCGDGVPNAPEESCDDGNAVSETTCPGGLPSCTICDATCHTQTIGTTACGDSITDPSTGETCDDGNTVTETCAYGPAAPCTVCDAACHSVTAPAHFCGDGVVDSANGEQCDGGAGCSATCQTVQAPVNGTAHAIAACASCREANCRDVDFSGIDALASCFTSPTGSQSPADAQLCVDVLNCAYSNNCAYGSTGMNGCWCTASPATCQSTAGLDANHGPCFDSILAATKSVAEGGTRDQQLDRAIIRFSQEVFPSGAAFWMLECDRGHCDECTP